MSDELNDEDRARVCDAEAEARAYIASFSWRPPVERITYAGGVPGIVSVFFVAFERAIEGFDDDRLWIVVGDLPSAYLVVDAGDTAQQVLRAYSDLMEEWVSAVMAKHSLADVFPVRADPNVEMAEMLHNRISFLRRNIIDGLI